jgi:2-polyprenyl-3-methyl-5-hydroxy-6-metoxy-1,4-benzoquinol methylase
MKISFQEFDAIYQRQVDLVTPLWSAQMQEEIAKHNRGWAAPYDFINYLRRSNLRYYELIQDLPDGAKTVCDVGGFWGVLPLALTEMGFQVTMTEAKKYYSGSFDPLFQLIESKGVRILDMDPFEDTFASNEKFDFVCIMAVLEHYPHSLKFFLNNVHGILNKGSRLFIEVPNIAYLNKRVRFLFGVSPITDLQSIYDSAIPFTGHHHEYTMKELRLLFQWMNLPIVGEHYINYSTSWNKLGYFLKRPVNFLLFWLFPTTREIIGVCGEKR